MNEGVSGWMQEETHKGKVREEMPAVERGRGTGSEPLMWRRRGRASQAALGGYDAVHRDFDWKQVTASVRDDGVAWGGAGPAGCPATHRDFD